MALVGNVIEIRTSNRTPIKKPIPIQAKRLFEECDPRESGKNKLPKNFELLNLNPNIYLINQFLTKVELKHLLEVFYCVD